MSNVLKEQVIDSVEAYAKSVENQAYDKVLKILRTNFIQLANILDSNESMNILLMSTGDRFDRLYAKRSLIRIKINMLLKIIDPVTELRYGNI